MATKATGTQMTMPAPTRRERQRAATYDEIVAVARDLLGKPETLSLRAIAAEMGLTAPALYRYVDSYHELLMLVAQAIFEDVISAMTRARDRYGDDDPAAQTIAATVAFRGWALAHPEEFGLIFANAAIARPAEALETGEISGPASQDATAIADPTAGSADIQRPIDQHPVDLSTQGGEGFGEFFADIFRRLWDRYEFYLPSDSELEPDLLKLLKEQRKSGTLPCDFPDRPLGLSWVFIRCWARLYGTVTLEVFKHMDHGIITSGALFRAMLDDNGRDLGFDDDTPRLRALTSLELARTASG